MFHRDKKHYVTSEIRKIPVAYLLNLEMTALDELEKRIEEEEKRSGLARKWVAGLKRIKQTLKKEAAMENRKTSIIIYPADFLASVHNFKKSEIANLIVAICEFNLFGATSVKLSELNKKRFDAIQQVIANHNEKWRQTCEINAQNAKRAVSRRQANAKRTVSEVIEFPSTGRQQEKELEKESDKVNDKDCRERETAFVDNLSYIGAPTAEDVDGYCDEIGITIDIPAFISWHNERGWKHGKKCIARDWQKAVRQWYCKDNELSLHEFEVAVLKREYAKELSKGSAL